MHEDRLDRDVSLSAELTEMGVKANAKSRLVSALDRLGGSLFDNVAARLEASTDVRRAKTEGEVEMIEAITRYGVEKLGASPDLAERAFTSHFKNVLNAQSNKDAVIIEAHKDLKETPPSADLEGDIPESFFSRFEMYAEKASTDELRHRWGRVLSAEVRRPGTISAKTMRTVDELSPNTARVFENLCAFRIDNFIPQCLSGEVNFGDRNSLIEAGLFVENGSKQVLNFNGARLVSGGSIWITHMRGEIAFGFRKGTKNLQSVFSGKEFLMNSGQPAVVVQVLTEAGTAIAEILPDRSKDRFVEMSRQLEERLAPDEVLRFRRGPGDNYVLSEW